MLNKEQEKELIEKAYNQLCRFFADSVPALRLKKMAEANILALKPIITKILKTKERNLLKWLRVRRWKG